MARARDDGTSIFNSVVATFTVVAMAFAFAALMTVIIDDGNEEVVASAGFPAPTSDIDFGAEAAEDFTPYDPALQPAPGGGGGH